MNSETGQLLAREEIENLDFITKAKCFPIAEKMMTFKQRQTMQVSQHDNKSALGRLRIKKKNSLRNKPCPCGSGVKFKKYCWSKAC